MLEICSQGSGDSHQAQREACLSHRHTGARVHTRTHTRTPSTVCTPADTCPRVPARCGPRTAVHRKLFPQPSSQTAHCPRTPASRRNPHPQPQPNAPNHTPRACKESKRLRNPLAKIPSLPQSGGVTQASVSFPQSLSPFSFFSSLFTASESSRPINLEGPTERRTHLYASLGLANT